MYSFSSNAFDDEHLKPNRTVSSFKYIWFKNWRVYKALGITSNLNRRLTARNRRFWGVAIVLNNDNRPEPAVLGGQPPVELSFEVTP